MGPPPVDDLRVAKGTGAGEEVAAVAVKVADHITVDPHHSWRVLAQAPVLTWMSDTQGSVVFLSAHWAEVTGVRVPDLLAGGLVDAIHPDDRRQAISALAGLGRSSVRIVREYRLKRADGAWRFLRDTAIPLRDESGSLSGHAGVCEDVTDRHEFLTLLRFQRALSDCLAHTHAGPEFLEELLRTICTEGGFDEASICRASTGDASTRLLLRFSESRFDRSECTCWRSGERPGTPTFRPPCSRATVPVVGSYPLVAGGELTGLLTLGSREDVEVFLPLLESFHGTAAVLGAILDLERVEEGLKTSEGRYRALLEQSSEGIYLFDPATHRLLEANRKFLQMTGYEQADIAAMTLESFVSHDAVSIAENVSRVVARGDVVVGERDYLRRDGSRVPVEVSASLVRWGREEAVLVNVRDVSEPKAAAKALESLSRRLQLILDSAGEGILGLDTRGQISFVNRSAAALLGCSAEELEGRESHPLWHHTRKDGSPHPEAECPILVTIRTGKRAAVTEDVFWRRDGTRFLVEYIATPLRQGEEIVGAVVVFRDVSREARLELVAAAMQTANSLGFVFSAVRHELGNPVNSVKMALSVLKKNLDRLDPGAVRGYVDRCLAELRRVEELLASLKTYSLYEDVHPQDLGLREFVTELGEFVRRDYAARGVTIDVDAGSEDVRVLADPRALRQVLLNLLANAAEAMGSDGGRVRVVLFSEEAWGGIRVVDDGPGMTAATLRHLFQPFYTTKADGTGLGLVIARKMMTRMNGTIEVESEPGRGTTIILALHAAAPAD